MYPKTLYGGGAYTVVKDEQQEAEAKAKGFKDPNETTTNENKVVVQNIVIENQTETANRPKRKR